jgi:hypothetical protein
MRLKLRRRELILIASFWLAGCALLGAVFYFGVLQSPSTASTANILRPQATFTVVYNQVTARSSQEVAFAQARDLWQEDAQLMAVMSTWESTNLESVGQPTTWTYRFYSPSTRRLFFVTVTPEGELIGTLHGERLYNAPQPIPLEDWAMDSPEALSAWLNYGGATMLAAMPGIQVVAQLQVRSQDSPLTWTIAGYDRVSQNYHSIFIDAKNKKVMRVESSLQ